VNRKRFGTRGVRFPGDDASQPNSLCRGPRLLTEQQINQSWRMLFKNGEFTEETLGKARILLDELRPESPLRHRLGTELDELCQLKLQKQS
jgi:hypothetical protein